MAFTQSLIHFSLKLISREWFTCNSLYYFENGEERFKALVFYFLVLIFVKWVTLVTFESAKFNPENSLQVFKALPVKV